MILFFDVLFVIPIVLGGCGYSRRLIWSPVFNEVEGRYSNGFVYVATFTLLISFIVPKYCRLLAA